MSVNGHEPSLESPSSDPGSSIRQDISLESMENSPAADGLNGSATPTVNGHKLDPTDGLSEFHTLELELERTKQEKDVLAAQYSNLLGRLTAMKTTLGNKLKQDAEELDRREQLINQLTAENKDLSATVETLKQELIVSHEEAERAMQELDTIRTRAFQENVQENLIREQELREAHSEIERLRAELFECEQAAAQDKLANDDAKTLVEALKRDLEVERGAREREAERIEEEQENSRNLQSVLADFEAAKNREIQTCKSQLEQCVQSLAEFKSRALTAEAMLDETRVGISRFQELEEKIKEKNLLIEKLRLEAVIINDHLMEALRRLRRHSSDIHVDRAWVTDVLLNFLSTPREDPKKFEILQILSNGLSWTDQQRERAGLQRSGGSATFGSSFLWGRSSNPPPAKPSQLDKSDSTESFSRLWVEFLLTEAASGDPSSPRSNGSLPTSPTHQSHALSISDSSRRLSSLSSSAMASSPNLTLTMPPRKGKDKDMIPS